MRSFRLPWFSSFKPIPRKTTPIRAILLAAAFFLTLAAPQAKALGPHGDIFAGYNHLWVNPTDGNGWQLDGHLKLAPFFGAEATVIGDSYDGGAQSYLYLFGPRVTVGVRKVHIFAHLLAGGQHVNNGYNAFVYGGGAGLDYTLIPHLAWRVEGDGFRHTDAAAGSFSTGPVLRF